MISVIGRVIDEANQPLTSVKVVALADWLLTDKSAKAVKVDSAGQFVLEVENIDPADVAALSPVVPSLRVRVLDRVGRQLSTDQVLDATVTNHNLGNLTVNRAEAEGLLVTNQTGTARFVSEGNAVKLLVDGLEAFGRVADEIQIAKNSINMTQLFFGVPKDFHPNNEEIDPATKEPREKANLVFKFSQTAIVPQDPGPADPSPRIGDERPERLLLKSVLDKKTIVRILMNEPTLSWPEAFFWLIVLTPVAAGIPAGLVAGVTALMGVGLPFLPLVLVGSAILGFIEYIKIRKVLEGTTDVDDLNHYFGTGLASEPVQRLSVRGFKQAAPDHGVQHCKMVIVDNDRAVVLGSPFSQRYWDTLLHQIDEPRRGGNESDIVHDLSVAVVGPAARDLFETFRLYWNEDLPKEQKLKPLPNLEPNTQTSGEDAIAKVQVVRTASGKRFKHEDGLNGVTEKGILEGYLRAIAAAKHYIYMENQYFTDGVITDALIAALKANDKLKLIMVVPIKPDVVFYPRRQAKRIEQIREAVGKERVGVFTRWSYDKRLNGDRPLVAPVYIHAKGAVVDDSWATIGSANLDGLSLDYNLLLSPLAFGETMACELNLNVLPDSPGAISTFAQFTRRRLWAEHLGILKNGVPNHEDSSLAPGPEHDWLESLWRPAAKRALKHVQEAKREDFPGLILEYPAEDGGCLDTPRKHLGALGVKVKPITQAVIRPITGSRKFHFSTGKWDKKQLIEDIKL
jgi:phosphatidylserine/phosphatidylglycerophosphate/cardiolipin synthase-like enzyme